MGMRHFRPKGLRVCSSNGGSFAGAGVLESHKSGPLFETGGTMRTLQARLRMLASLTLSALLLAAAMASSAMAVSPSPQLLQRMATNPALAASIQAGLAAEHASGIELPATHPLGSKGVALPQGVYGPPTTLQSISVPAPSGTLRWLALCVDFSDKPATSTATSLSNLLFKDVTGPESVRGYYREVSGGKFDFSTVASDSPSALGWLRMPHPYSYYVGSGKGEGTYPNNSQRLTEDACAAAAAAGVNFSKYDNNHDGFVDGIIVIHAGIGAEVSGSPSTDIWSHSWATYSPPTYNGVTVFSYTTEPEFCQHPGDSTIGVFCHELGHNFGLPDFYDIDYTSEGAGAWSLMAGGSWNGVHDGDSPSRPDAWSQIKLGFASPTVLTSQATPAHIRSGTPTNTGTILRIKSSAANSTQYDLVENRQRTGTDAGLPGAGVLVWHVDDTRFDNTDESHYWLDLEEAHGGIQDLETADNWGDAGDPFPGTSHATSFSDTTDPSAKLYGGANSRIAIDRISASGPDMTALVFPDTAVATSDAVAPSTSSNARQRYYGSATISISATDYAGYGVQSTRWTLDGALGSGVLASTSALGSHTLQYASTDWAGNVESTKTATFTVYPADPIAPSTSCDATRSYIDTATITLTPSDAGSGVDRTDWTLDGTEGSGTVVVTTAGGAHTLSYWSTDLAGNVESAHVATFTVVPRDKTAPVTSSNAVASYIETAEITFSAEDTESGVALTDWTLDGDAGSGTTISTSVYGPHTLRFWSTDVAGNVEDTQVVTFTVIGDTTVSLQTAPSVASYGTSVQLAGVVSVGPGIAIPAGQYARLQRLVGSTWVDAGVADAAVGSNGAYAFALRAFARQTYRVTTVPTAELQAGTSPQVTLQVGAVLGTPTVPRRVRPKKTFTTSGLVTPGHVTIVRVSWYKVAGSTLRLYSTKTVRVSASGRWSVKRSLPKGSWAVRATSQDSLFALSVSAYKKFPVK